MSTKNDSADRIIERANFLLKRLNRSLDEAKGILPKSDELDLVPHLEPIQHEEEESYPVPKLKVDWREQFRKNWPDKEKK